MLSWRTNTAYMQSRIQDLVGSELLRSIQSRIVKIGKWRTSTSRMGSLIILFVQQYLKSLAKYLTGLQISV